MQEVRTKASVTINKVTKMYLRTKTPPAKDNYTNYITNYYWRDSVQYAVKR